jgi:hypothetical protein
LFEIVILLDPSKSPYPERIKPSDGVVVVLVKVKPEIVEPEAVLLIAIPCVTGEARMASGTLAGLITNGLPGVFGVMAELGPRMVSDLVRSSDSG